MRQIQVRYASERFCRKLKFSLACASSVYFQKSGTVQLSPEQVSLWSAVIYHGFANNG